MEQASVDSSPAEATRLERLAGKFELGTVRRRYENEHDASPEESARALDELKRFLIVCHLSDKPLGAGGVLDDIWHVFVLFTLRYEHFCRTLFGRVIHHIPEEDLIEGSHDRHENYRNTLSEYVRLFGEAPDFSIWPRLPTAELGQDPQPCGSCGGGCNGRSCAPPQSPRCHHLPT